MAKKKRRSSKQVTDLKDRIKAIKGKVPKSPVLAFMSRFPEFQRYPQSSRVANVYGLKIVDEEITEKFELLSKEYINNKKQNK